MTIETKNIELKVQNHSAHIYFRREKRLNAINTDLADELYITLKNISKNEKIKTVVIEGKGKSFCSGGDVKSMYDAQDKSSLIKELTKKIHQCIILMRSMKKPIIASINGAATGAGFSLMLGCDIIIANKDAIFSTSFIKIGLAPGCGTQLLAQLIGYHRACEFFLTGKKFTAIQAEKMGIINKAVEENNRQQEIDKYIQTFSKLPMNAIAQTKELINKSFYNTMQEQFDLESNAASSCAKSKDFIEGITAFIEKRKTNF